MVSKRIELHKNAAADYQVAFDWYFDRSPLAAQKFDEELGYALQRIAENPQRWPMNILGTRKFFLRHFPFAVVYRELPSVIQILAVAHGRRKPDYWRDRL
jgi:toxin ParE1/3/4